MVWWKYIQKEADRSMTTRSECMWERCCPLPMCLLLPNEWFQVLLLCWTSSCKGPYTHLRAAVWCNSKDVGIFTLKGWYWQRNNWKYLIPLLQHWFRLYKTSCGQCSGKTTTHYPNCVWLLQNITFEDPSCPKLSISTSKKKLDYISWSFTCSSNNAK